MRIEATGSANCGASGPSGLEAAPGTSRQHRREGSAASGVSAAAPAKGMAARASIKQLRERPLCISTTASSQGRCGREILCQSAARSVCATSSQASHRPVAPSRRLRRDITRRRRLSKFLAAGVVALITTAACSTTLTTGSSPGFGVPSMFDVDVLGFVAAQQYDATGALSGDQGAIPEDKKAQQEHDVHHGRSHGSSASGGTAGGATAKTHITKVELLQHSFQSPMAQDTAVQNWRLSGASVPLKDSVLLFPGSYSGSFLDWGRLNASLVGD